MDRAAWPVITYAYTARSTSSALVLHTKAKQRDDDNGRPSAEEGGANVGGAVQVNHSSVCIIPDADTG